MTTSKPNLETQRDRAVACIATASGRGAVATVLAQGAMLTAVLGKHFVPATRGVGSISAKRPRFGHWIDGDFREEIVVGSLDELPVSEPSRLAAIEIHCHGGRVPAQRILDTLLDAGFTGCSWEAWCRGRGRSPVAAAAEAALANARTERSAWILMDQVQGAWERDYRRGEQAMRNRQTDTLREMITRWQGLLPAGLRLSQPARVVLAGPPNVGKSSLLNRIVGFERAIVYDQPGTTRDSLWVATAIDGWEFEFWDTAGIRDAVDAIEWAGVQMSRTAIEQADLVLWTNEPHQPSVPPPALPPGARLLPVVNKADLVANPALDADWDGEPIMVSARCGRGMDRLLKRIRELLIPFEPCQGESVPFSGTLRTWVTGVADAIENGGVQPVDNQEFHRVWNRVRPELFAESG